MEYQDIIYGKIEITEPLVLDLMGSLSMQRLKGIDQHGHYEIYFPGSGVSRFEHSIGVFILLKKFNAPLLEQVAGLLHDISHTVFSHVADYIFHDGSGEYQNFQDDALEDFIKNSEIPGILKKYGIGWKDILDDSKFPLKENDLPDLCADRIDYFLRDALAFKKISQKQVNDFLDNLVAAEGKWVLRSKNVARKYAYLFLDVNNVCWSGLETGVMFKTMGELMKYCIDQQIIVRDDLFTTDKRVWGKIRNKVNEDKKLALLVDRADNKYVYKASGKSDYDLYALCKSRVVDPLFIDGEELKRVSEVDEEFARLKEKYSKPKEYYIKFLELRK